MNLVRAAINWGHVGVRAAAYGTVSCTLGPLTDRRASRWAMRQWCIGASDGLGIQRTLIHGGRLDPQRQCVYVANHLSQLDILVLGSYLESDYRWLAKDAVFKVPFLGWHLKIAGHVPVYRGERRAQNRSLPERLHTVVKEGASLLFFPEGTRSPDGRLQPFRLGAFYAAVDEGLPVVPLVLRGTDRLLKKGARDLAIHPDRECSVTVLPGLDPITPATPDHDARREAAIDLCAETVAAVARELDEPAPGVMTDDRTIVRAQPTAA
jgi:1-acyl-sn-glycerol-3-phosphate acyltransferase